MKSLFVRLLFWVASLVVPMSLKAAVEYLGEPESFFTVRFGNGTVKDSYGRAKAEVFSLGNLILYVDFLDGMSVDLSVWHIDKTPVSDGEAESFLGTSWTVPEGLEGNMRAWARGDSDFASLSDGRLTIEETTKSKELSDLFDQEVQEYQARQNAKNLEQQINQKAAR